VKYFERSECDSLATCVTRVRVSENPDDRRAEPDELGSVRLRVRADITHFHHFKNRKGNIVMNTLTRISDIPPDELCLLPLIGLQDHIAEDPLKLNSRSRQIGERARESLHFRRSLLPARPDAGALPAGVGNFVTDWQMQDEQHQSSLRGVEREDFDEDEDLDDPDEEDAGEDTDWRQMGG